MTPDKESKRKFPSGSASHDPVPKGLSTRPQGPTEAPAGPACLCSQRSRDGKRPPCPSRGRVKQTGSGRQERCAEWDSKQSGNSAVID